MPNTIKVSDYAKKVGRKSVEIIKYLNKNAKAGISEKGYSAKLTPEWLRMLDDHFGGVKKEEKDEKKAKEPKRKILRIIKKGEKGKEEDSEEETADESAVETPEETAPVKKIRKAVKKEQAQEETVTEEKKEEEKEEAKPDEDGARRAADIVKERKREKKEREKAAKLKIGKNDVEVEVETKKPQHAKKEGKPATGGEETAKRDKYPDKKRGEVHEKRDKGKKKGKKTKFEEVKTINQMSEKSLSSEEIDIYSRKKKKKKKKVKIDKDKIAQSVEKTIKSIHTDKSTKKKYKERGKTKEEGEEGTEKLLISEHIILSDLAEKMDIDPIDLIEKAIGMGIMVTINQRLDFDNASILAMEFGFDVERIAEDEPEESEEEIFEETEQYDEKPRNPVITIMGHVDHGKTTLIDYLRKSRIVDSEHGKITQDIGAYIVQTDHGKITVIDTPGHEAFTAMRARGAEITDIAIIVIAANDGVMPQTKEAINHASLAKVPFIIAINKVDLPEANPEKVKQELLSVNVVVEDFGGTVPAVPISAKTGKGVDELLESVLLQADLMELTAPVDGPVKGTVIEVRQDKGLGPTINCVVQKGTLRKGDVFVVGSASGKVRKLLNEFKEEIKSAGPSSPVVIVGASSLPQVGDTIVTMESEKNAKEAAKKKHFAYKEQMIKKREITSMDSFERQLKNMQKKEINLIIKGKAFGSIEALADSLQMLSNDEIKISVIYKEVGIVTENDVNIAVASGASIVAFNTPVDSNARIYAKREGIVIKSFNVIYDVIDEINKIMDSLNEPEFENIVTGSAEVRKTFRISKMGTIAGLYVTEGFIARNASVIVMRNGEELGSFQIRSLKRFQDDVKKVDSGYECALMLDGYNDFEEGDILKAVEKRQKNKAE